PRATCRRFVPLTARSDPMSRDAGTPPRESRWVLTNPWPYLLAALMLVVLAVLIQRLGQSWVPVRGLLLFGGMVLGLAGVGLRLRGSSEDVEERFRAAGFLALAAAVPFVGSFALELDWDGVSLLLGVCVGVTLAGAGLLMLPRLARRLALTVLVLF